MAEQLSCLSEERLQNSTDISFFIFFFLPLLLTPHYFLTMQIVFCSFGQHINYEQKM